MAADYLAMQKELDDMIKYKADLEDKLRQSESQMDEMASKSDNEQVKKFVQLNKKKVIEIFYYYLFFKCLFKKSFIVLIFTIAVSWVGINLIIIYHSFSIVLKKKIFLFFLVKQKLILGENAPQNKTQVLLIFVKII